MIKKMNLDISTHKIKDDSMLKFESDLLYHGSLDIVQSPKYGFGSSNNDYGKGFYCTYEKDKAVYWSALKMALNESTVGYVNCYSCNFDELNVLKFDDLVILAWIAELLYYRGYSLNSNCDIYDVEKFCDRYKLDVSSYDIYIGYRADDSYFSIIEAFLDDILTIDDLDFLFRKGKLGYQICFKSEKSFNKEFISFEDVIKVPYSETALSLRKDKAIRKSCFDFIANKRDAILRYGRQPSGLRFFQLVENEYIFSGGKYHVV